MKKICITCKEAGKFYSNGYTPNGIKKYKPTCIKCEEKRRNGRHMANILKALKEQGKKFVCEVCGYDKNSAALEFHHIKAEKKKK